MELGQLVAGSYNEETGEVTLRFNEGMPEDFANPVAWQPQNYLDLKFAATITVTSKFPPELPTPPEE